MSKNFLLGHHLKQPTYPKNYSSDLISAFDYVLSSSDRLITPINCYKTHHQPNSFTHSHKFIVLGSLDPYPIPSGFGLQFVTLQLTPSVGRISASEVYNSYGGFRTTANQSTPCRDRKSTRLNSSHI